VLRLLGNIAHIHRNTLRSAATPLMDQCRRQTCRRDAALCRRIHAKAGRLDGFRAGQADMRKRGRIKRGLAPKGSEDVGRAWVHAASFHRQRHQVQSQACRRTDQSPTLRALEKGFRMSPLAGIRVVEIAQNLAGPFAGQILAMLGAEVIKLERPEGGDDARGWGPPMHEGTATTFIAVNRGKRSLSLDLRNDADRALLMELVGESDVVVQNMRPGALEDLGRVARRSPRVFRG
jgi:hypothetical protein